MDGMFAVSFHWLQLSKLMFALELTVLEELRVSLTLEYVKDM